MSPKKPLAQRVAEAIIKAHRATGSGLAYPMSLAEMEAAVAVVLKQSIVKSIVEEEHARHKVAGQGQ
jgi:hypothetical protein